MVCREASADTVKCSAYVPTAADATHSYNYRSLRVVADKSSQAQNWAVMAGTVSALEKHKGEHNRATSSWLTNADSAFKMMNYSIYEERSHHNSVS